MSGLRYGTPPKIEDCTDIGTVPLDVVPKTVSNQGRFIGHTSLEKVWGFQVPGIRRAWMTVAHYRNRDVPNPYSVKIPGLGTLVCGRDELGENWEVI